MIDHCNHCIAIIFFCFFVKFYLTDFLSLLIYQININCNFILKLLQYCMTSNSHANKAYVVVVVVSVFSSADIEQGPVKCRCCFVTPTLYHLQLSILCGINYLETVVIGGKTLILTDHPVLSFTRSNNCFI